MNQSIHKYLYGLVWLLLIVSTNIHAQSLVTYYHTDVLGSPIAATDDHGNDLWSERYQPYGERIDNEPESNRNKIWYTGKPVDELTGLSYYGARYYDPVIGRFISPDPVGFTETSIHSFNRYTYSNNNPYKYVDPDGNFAITAGILLYAAFKAWDVYDAYDAVTDPNVSTGAATFAVVAALDPSGLSGKAKKVKRVGSIFGDISNSAPRLKSLGSAVNRSMGFSQRQLQHAFKHAGDFGITGNWNKANGNAFQDAIMSHIGNPATEIIQGTYRGKPANHFYNPNTGLNVIRDENMNFLSGWRLSTQQRHYVSKTGNLGGG
ncbi:MAG: RHS domain-containing protein [Candidatus Thiodiazotropha sp. (ex Monitilora ramsayi)]|nr:RHS domain-containing protein [Candidatus Thiodiazotropha sp. (ex Monitilora ramsayi)]